MISRTLVLVWSALSGLQCAAQLNFMYSYGGTGTEYGYDIAVRPDGRYAIAGQTQSSEFVLGACEGIFPVVQMNGMLGSTRVLGGVSCDILTAVEALPDTGAFLVGHTISYGLAEYDAQVLRINKNNGLVWSRRVGTANYDQVYSSALTHDGGVVIAGLYGTTNSNADPWIAKISGTGTLVWSTVLTASGSDRFLYVERTSDNGFIATGESSSFPGTGPDIIVAKFSSTGALQWQRGIIGASAEAGQGALEAIGGGFVISGYTYSYGAGAKDVFLCKLDASGVVQWFKTYGDANPNDGFGLVHMADGSLVVAGTASHGFFVNDNVMLIKTNAAGVLQWSKEFGQPSRLETGHALARAADGGFAITGYVWNCPGTTYEVLLTKTLSNGACPNCDSLIVNYTSSTFSPATSTVFGTATGGTVNTIAPVNTTVLPNMTPCSDVTVLPIELLSFTGEALDGVNVLRWITASEQDNDHFELERSADGGEWASIASVPGAGASQSTIHYEAKDEHPLALGYYRLQQVDYNGASSISGVIALRHQGASAQLALVPNPGSDALTVSLGDARIERVEVFANDGRRLLEMAVNAADGRAYLDVRTLPAGSYVVQASGGGTTRTANWIKIDR